MFENLRCALLWSMGYRYSFWTPLWLQRELNERTDAMLEDLNLAPRRDTAAGLLSYADQRALEIGMTIAGGASVILLDEPTAGMSNTETDNAVELIRRISKGKTLVMVEHDMKVVFDLADVITVLVYGQVIASGTAAGRARQSRGAGSLSRGAGRRMILEVKDLHAYYGQSHILHGVTMDVDDGEIVSLLGTQRRRPIDRVQVDHGAGDRPRRRSKFRGKDIAGLRPDQVAHCGIGYVPEDRQIFPTLTVRQNLELGLKRSGKFGRWNFDDVFKLFPNLKARQDTSAGVLSGGEQQMLTMCRTLMGDPDLMLIDEPTEGLAPKMVEQVGELLGRDRAARRRRCCWSNRSSPSRSRSRRGSTSWAMAVSCSRARPAISAKIPPCARNGSRSDRARALTGDFNSTDNVAAGHRLAHGDIPARRNCPKRFARPADIVDSKKNRRPTGSKLCLGLKRGSFAALRHYSR